MSGDRRQSAIPASAPTKTDPRPIADRAFQQEYIKQLLNFLMTKGYEHAISHRSLARPSGKDFTNIVTFMLRLVDPNFQDGSMKMEDEIAMNFKALGYPFPVSKTALVAAGSPHTWPSLLAALAWLMERIQSIENSIVDGNVDPGHFDSLEELENKTDKAFFKYLSETYSAFLRGEEELIEQLENALADRFERDDAIIEQEIEQMTDKNAVVVEQINNLTFGEKDLENYVQKKEGYVTDLEQFHDLIQQMDQHVSTLTHKKKDRAQELDDTNRKFARTTARVEELKNSIDSQALSLEDVQKMHNELKGVEEGIDRAIASRDEYRKSLWESQSEIENLLSGLESIASFYNAQLGELWLLVFVPKEDCGGAIVVKSNAVAESSQLDLLGVDLEHTVQSSMQTCKHIYVDKISKAKGKYQESLDQMERSEEDFAEALDSLKIVEGKIEKLEENVEGEKHAQEAKLGVRSREVTSMETKMASLRNPVTLEEQMAGFERQCAELVSLRMKYEQENVSKKKTAFEEIARACAAIKEYDEFCRNKITEVDLYQTEKRTTHGAIRRPSVL